MPPWLKLVLKPVRFLIDPLQRAVLRKLAAQIDSSLAPVRDDLMSLHADLAALSTGHEKARTELGAINEKLEALLEIQTRLRSIAADCDLIRDLDPMFNSFLRDQMRLQVSVEELSWRLDRGMADAAGRVVDAPSERGAA